MSDKTKIIFTKHARLRGKERRLSKQDIINTIKFPSYEKKKSDKYYFKSKTGRGGIEVVCEKTTECLKVITVYWD